MAGSPASTMPVSNTLPAEAPPGSLAADGQIPDPGGRATPAFEWRGLMLDSARTFWSVDEVIEILSAATVFACPSVYEPLGIVNLEAMACTTAVVASDVGGIPEVVADGETGLLVPYVESDPDGFETGFAAAVTELVTDPARAARYGLAGRDRALAHFSWATIAEQTHAMYSTLL